MGLHFYEPNWSHGVQFHSSANHLPGSSVLPRQALAMRQTGQNRAMLAAWQILSMPRCTNQMAPHRRNTIACRFNSRIENLDLLGNRVAPSRHATGDREE